MFAHVRAPTKFSKASNDQVSNLVELRIATHQEHISRNSICQHLFAGDAIVAKCKKDPRHIRLDLGVTNHSQGVEEVHDPLLNQDIYRLLR